MIRGEAPPTSGLLPRMYDLWGRAPEPFDAAVAAYVGAREALITCSASAAMVIALTALKRRSARRTVIIPGYTCTLVPLAIARAGLRAVACDVVPGGFDMDSKHLARLVNDDTLCVMPTHFGGVLTDVARTAAVVKALAPEAYILEDAAQAFGARWGGLSVGLAGDIGVYSFAAGKGLTLMEGGAMVCRSPELMAEMRAAAEELAPSAPFTELRRAAELVGYHLVYNLHGLRIVYGRPRRHWIARGDDIRACSDDLEHIPMHPVGAWRQAVGARALRRLPEHLARSRANFAALGVALADVRNVNTHEPEVGAELCATFRFISLENAAKCRAALDALWRSPLGVTKLFARAIGDYPAMAGLLEPSPTPNARDLAARTLTVSTSSLLTDADRAVIASEIRAASALSH